MGNKEKGYFVGDNKYYCWYCGEIKLIEDFTKDKSKSKGFKSRCKECFNRYIRNYRKINKNEI
jgi:hypothetical protein